MLVLSLIALIAACAALYGFIEWFNNYTQAKARYEFFTKGHTAAVVLSYGMMFFGTQWFKSAMTSNEDILNGVVVIIIGAIILISVIVNNFRNTPKKLALIGTVAQLILYIPIAIAAVFIVLMMLAVLAQTKPTYNLNSRD
ncbi:MAG: hypothetical protein B7Y17_01695 [Sulfuricurvum sp. 24-42-5]|jgi:uncharacterized membrane protein YidH (DUF202 family)|nr:MAG: hypothetical protein B7Y17_01695 [Sulfuricurvum sp. 24-42-5]